MRNATILVVRLRGAATEVIKNIVLAGIGKLVLVDDAAVTEEDLGAGFFFRDEDVGKKVGFSHDCVSCGYSLVDGYLLIQRVDAAKARIESLNPLVAVQTVSTPSVLEGRGLDMIVQAVDLVCVTDWNRNGLVS